MSAYPYQLEGASFLASHARRRSYLADEMGLGKTVQAILATRQLAASRVTIVCPASVVENWRREWETWEGRSTLPPTIVSYAKLIRSPVEQTELVILDEAHYCKTPSSKRTKAALKLAAGAKYAWLLSGTPMPNDPRELYPVARALYPEWCEEHRVTTAFKWMDRFCVWAESDYGYRVWGNKPAARTELAPFLRTWMLRRRLTDVALELPPLRTTVQYLDADPNLAYELEKLGVQGDDEHMSRLRRMLGTYKAPRIAKRLVAELQDDPALQMVVLYHHHDTGNELADAFDAADLSWVGFDGSTPSADRQFEIDTFQSGAARVFLAQQGAAGTGITLTRASEIVLVEPSWSPSDNEQAIKRIHRIGQEHPCRARLFAVPDSLDEAVMLTLTRKTKMVQEVVDG